MFVSTAWEITVLSTALVLYNNLITTIPGAFHQRFYVAGNLAFLALLLLWAHFGLHLSTHEMGLTWSEAGTSAIWGVVVGITISGPLFLLLVAPPSFRARFGDPRTAGFTRREAAYRGLVRIPLGTAFFEEVAFRSILYGALLSFGVWQGIWGSSLVFGLWHVRPTLDLARARGEKGLHRLAMSAIAGIVVTIIAGGIFAIMRHQTNSVVGPILAHALINSLTLGASYLNRRPAVAIHRDLEHGDLGEVISEGF